MLLSKTTILVLLVVMLEKSLGFVPKKIIDDLIESVDAASDEMDFGRVSKSVSHDVILKRGLIRSLITYFHEKSEGPAKIRIDDPERYLNDFEKLFTDYYGHVVGKMRAMGLNTLLKTDFEPLVASVDLNPDTKDLPSAHFDAESFVESNQRVIDYTSKILTAIDNMDYVLARRFTAQILHTIHDFYSHSNWVEMGNNEINRVIGTDEFAIENRLVATTDSDACLSNCELVEIACSKPTQVLLDMMNQIKPDSAIACPLRYYKCSNNIGLLDRLISGFYTDQKLKDGSTVVNPGGLNKCNHGGLLDSNSYSIDALGGINKDSGIYLISPHADLHLKAAHLAELHTEAFFNLIKEKVGRDRFVEFLKL